MRFDLGTLDTVSDRCPLGYSFRILIIFCRKVKLSDDGSVDLDVGRTSVGISILPCKNFGKILNYTFGPQHDKTIKMTRAPCKDSVQPRHLIEVFAVRMKQPRVLSYQLAHSEDSDQTGWMPRLI